MDVTSTEDIILWYGTRYQVNLGDTSRLDYKVDCMNDAILQMTAKILAPIIILALEKLVEQGDGRLYCMMLALSILSNYDVIIL